MACELPYIDPATARQYSYYVIPQMLISDPAFSGIDCTAKLIYSLMLNRLSLSAENAEDYTDPQGRLYIVYTVEEIAETLQISKPTAVKMVTQLCEAGLVEKKRQGQGRPSILYLRDFTAAAKKRETPSEPAPEEQKTDFENLKNLTSRSKKIEILEVKNFESNKNDLSNTDLSNIPSFPRADMEPEGKKEGLLVLMTASDLESLDELTLTVKESIEYDVLEERWGEEIAQNVLSLIVSVLSRTGYVTMGGNQYPEEVVKKRYRSLTFEDVDLALEKLFATPDVRNQNAYLTTLLYNAPGSAELQARAQYIQYRAKYQADKTGTSSGFFNA